MLELASLVAHHARYRPDCTALVFEGERLTWREFGARVARVGNMLRALASPRRQGRDRARQLPRIDRARVGGASIGAALVPLSPLLLPAGWRACSLPPTRNASLPNGRCCRCFARSGKRSRHWPVGCC